MLISATFEIDLIKNFKYNWNMSLRKYNNTIQENWMEYVKLI